MIIFTQNQPITFEHIDAVKEMADKIKRVRDLHKSVELLTDYGMKQICQECYEVAGDRERAFYPCYTIQALDGEANG